MRGHHPAGLQVGAVILERVSDDRRRAQMRRGRVPGDRDRVLGHVDDGRHGRGRGEHGGVGGAVQPGSRRFLHAERRRPRSLAALRGRGARVQARVGHFELCGENIVDEMTQL